MPEPKRQKMSDGTKMVYGEAVPVTYLEIDESDDATVDEMLPPYQVLWDALTSNEKQEVIQFFRDILPPQ